MTKSRLNKKILVIFGTRPEAIKLAPLAIALKEHFEVSVCVTAQQREMMDQVLELFDIRPKYDLDIMKPGQDLFDITSNILKGIKKILQKEKPDLVIVQGDTSTTMAAALAAFYLRIPVGHVEAGLRTYDISSPFPEELNRQATSRMASFHFAPTEISRNNLIDEKIDSKKVFVTGNTVIDALFSTVKKAREVDFPKSLLKKCPFLSNQDVDKSQIILITGHRRESFGSAFVSICEALKEIALKYPKVELIYPVHLNPNVQEPVNRILSGVSNIHLVDALDYLSFVKLMDLSYLILTDSGGVQEEAPSLGKPVIVFRDVTERLEAVNAGTVRIVGTEKSSIISNIVELLENKDSYLAMSRAHNPYGNGNASEKITEILWKNL